MVIPSTMGKIRLAEKQLSEYNYTFPRAPNVSECFTVDFG
jgi:hypothetical protein